MDGFDAGSVAKQDKPLFRLLAAFAAGKPEFATEFEGQLSEAFNERIFELQHDIDHGNSTPDTPRRLRALKAEHERRMRAWHHALADAEYRLDKMSEIEAAPDRAAVDDAFARWMEQEQQRASGAAPGRRKRQPSVFDAVDPIWPAKPEPEPEKPVLRLYYGFDSTTPQPLGTVVKGLLHAGSVTLIYGPPKSGKSFLATDLALTIAATVKDDGPVQWLWMGHDIVRPGPVLYVACEGHAGFWKRLDAAGKKRGWTRDTFPKGFILATGRPKLIRADPNGFTYAPDPSSILAALADAKRLGLDPVAIFIDTVFASFGAGNVNASPDMNVYLACVAVLTDQGYAVALVHHEIKAGGSPAGSVSLIGGADNVVHVWRETETSERRFWQVAMAKDDAETPPRAFTLDVVSIGTDPDGQAASSCVIRDAGPAPEAALKKKAGRPPSEDSELATDANLILGELNRLLKRDHPHLGDWAEDRFLIVGREAIPAITRDYLRETLIDAGILVTIPDEADKTEQRRIARNNDQRLHRALKRLKNQNKIACDAKWVAVP